jgi:hypothetical protein
VAALPQNRSGRASGAVHFGFSFPAFFIDKRLSGY